MTSESNPDLFPCWIESTPRRSSRTLAIATVNIVKFTGNGYQDKDSTAQLLLEGSWQNHEKSSAEMSLCDCEISDGWRL